MAAIKKKPKKFASTYEQKLTEYFDANGILWEYEPVKIPWQPAPRVYKPDFKITMPDGEEFLLEAKGYFDGSARSKMIQVKAQHPELDIRMAFMRGTNVISANAKVPTTYEAWAKRYGFTCWDVPIAKGTTSAKRPRTKRATACDGQAKEEGSASAAKRTTKRTTKVSKPSKSGAQPVRSRRRTAGA